MNTASWPYFDPDFDGLSERVYGPVCRVTIDNESSDECTVLKIDSVNKQGLLLEVVQALTDMNLTILKSYISSDAGWFMDVFHVKDGSGNKVTDQNVINYIQKAIGANKEAMVKARARNTKFLESKTSAHEPTAIEMRGKDRPGLFSEISAALADLHINVVEAHAWSHNARLACVAYISDQSTSSPIDDHRLATIEDHLTTVLRATTSQNTGDDVCTNQQEVKHFAGLPDHGRWEGTMTDVERRLHQLMLSVRDFDGPPSASGPSSSWPRSTANIPLGGHDDEEEREKKECQVRIESCDEKGYSIVTVSCKDRRRLMFDTVCTLTDLQYVIFHASVDSDEGYAFQEYFIRHVDGCALNTEGEKERVIKCLEAAIERRVCEGIRLELRATNRVGLLSDITRVLRENGLAVVRADIATQGENAVNAFYVRDMSGNDVDMEFIKTMKREMGPIDLDVKNETPIIRRTSPGNGNGNGSGNGRPRFSVGDILRSHVERLSHNIAIG
ncbi:ACT domain-containing protein ACR2 [Coffea eugenioides]|uniref:ACT domain-containing protein ACR2 n=1 Tax=Coffea eugenioides TaxID=49369 RepID=UPI000F6145EE|nr:ACT domain-containing protein ACR2 [Coffea eugenioides]